MSSPASRSLPARPDLAQQQKQAKELLRSFTAGDAEAGVRVRTLLPDKQRITLADAQFVLAREYGFASWAALKRRIAALADESGTPEEQLREAIGRRDAGAVRGLFRRH